MKFGEKKQYYNRNIFNDGGKIPQKANAEGCGCTGDSSQERERRRKHTRKDGKDQSLEDRWWFAMHTQSKLTTWEV